MFNITKESDVLTEKFLQAVHRLYGWEYDPDEVVLAEKRKTYGWIIEEYILKPLSGNTKLSISDRLQHLPFPPPISTISDFLYVQAQMIAVTTLMNASESIEEFKVLYKNTRSHNNQAYSG
ncbi:hypothetical protein [Polluticoccus soli]|uniref:hypothetical protein n=1 Tax=Polluticoccus soli TaxID=3034150 RepID=UPI0023E340B6|nr:hypothetical protein [Flavipsychrobacter sp. JY13-12]